MNDKLDIYKDLYARLKNVKRLRITSQYELKGNLAFFVDNYYGTQTWDVMSEELGHYIETKGVNQICWFLSTAICSAFEIKYGWRIADTREAQLYNAIDLKEYVDGCLDDFEIVKPKYYPDFFVNYMWEQKHQEKSAKTA